MCAHYFEGEVHLVNLFSCWGGRRCWLTAPLGILILKERKGKVRGGGLAFVLLVHLFLISVKRKNLY